MNRHAELAGSGRYHDSPTLRHFHGRKDGFFIFYFLFSFFTKIYFRFENLQEYTPAAPLPGGSGAAGAFVQECLLK